MAIELVRKQVSSTKGGEFGIDGTHIKLGTSGAWTIGATNSTATHQINGAFLRMFHPTNFQTIRMESEGTVGNAFVGLLQGWSNNANVELGSILIRTNGANNHGMLEFRTTNSGAVSAKGNIINTGAWQIGPDSGSNNLVHQVLSGSGTVELRVFSTNAGATATTLSIRNSGGSAFNDGMKLVHGGGIFKFRDLADATIGSVDLTAGGLWTFGNTTVAQARTTTLESDVANRHTLRWNVGGVIRMTLDAGSTANWSSNLTMQVISNGSGGVQLTSGATAWAAISDERQKDIIEPISDALSKIGSLRTVIGKYKTEEGMRRAFLIAQDVMAVLPEAVYQDSDEDQTLSLRYSDMIPLLVAAINEMKAEFDAYVATHP